MLVLDDDGSAPGADLKAKVSDAWQEFARTLATTLRRLAPGTTLDLTLDPTASGTGDAVYATQISVGDGPVLTATAVGNATLPDGFRLDRGAIGALVALGWSPPGVVDGSGEDFGLQLPMTDANRMAVIASRTLRDVYGAPHPAFLTYEATGADGEAVVVPTLGAARLLFRRATWPSNRTRPPPSRRWPGSATRWSNCRSPTG